MSEDAKFNLVAGGVAAVTMVLSIVAFWWIWALVQPPAPKPIPTSPIYNNYDPAGNHLKPESLAAMQAYTQENSGTQRVEHATDYCVHDGTGVRWTQGRL